MKAARRDWTDHEDRLLRKCWAEDGPTEDLARDVNRSVTACRSRAQFLGLTRTRSRQSRRSASHEKRESDYFNMRSVGYTASQTREAMMLTHAVAETLSSAWADITRDKAATAASGPSKDDQHVAAVRDAGGFVAREQRGTMICDVYPDGRVVTLWQVRSAA